MFTSRAEHRLLLREDNADIRLTPIGRELGLVDDERWRLFEEKRRLSDVEFQRLNATRIQPTGVPQSWTEKVLNGTPLSRDFSAFELLLRPEVTYDDLLEVAGRPDWSGVDDRLPAQVRTQIEVRAKYAGYIERQQDEIERQQRNEETRLPEDLDYLQVTGLSHEVRQKLGEARPATVGQASRVPGVTPAAISLLLVHLKKRTLKDKARVA
jgi:tRNA uridine 5-carboxymethylaminomethyl modification enzyme